jgi:mono/diheme cytochrome c family protein
MRRPPSSSARAIRAAVLLLAVLAAAATWLSRPLTLHREDLPSHTADRANGERLFHAGGCAACHGARLEGGLEITTAFGTFRAPNISPDREAGIGSWSALDFVNAVTRGVSPGGRHYYPAFPYTSYMRMQVEDVLDLKAYLDTFEAVPERARGHDVGLPWNIRRGIGLWKRLYLHADPIVPLPASDPVLERGRYLVEAVGHCAECHTPRDRLGGFRLEHWLAGGPSPDGEGRVPNITPHGDGLADWSAKDLIRYLKSGFTPDYDTVGGSMAEVQENLARLPDEDLRAMAAYLEATPPQPDPRD